MNNDVKTERQVISEFQSFISAKVSQLASTSNILMHDKGNSSAEAVTKIGEYQVYKYLSVMTKSCKNFDDLANIRRNVVNSATNFRDKFNELKNGYEEYARTHSNEEIKSYVLQMKSLMAKHTTLKQVFLVIKDTLKVPAVKEKVNVNNAPKVTQVTNKRAVVNKQPTVSVSDIEDSLKAINQRIFDLKLSKRRIDPNNEEQQTRANLKIMEASKIREEAISKLVDPGELYTELQLVSSAEEMAASAYGRVKRKPYNLDINKFIPAYEQLNRIISDLKINGVKSETFRKLHAEDHKTDTATFAKDLSKYCSIRDDMVLAIVEGRSDLKDIKKHMLEISSLEHTYNLEGGFQAFKSKGGTLVGKQRTRDLYKSGFDTLVSGHDYITTIAREELNKKGTVIVKDREETYEELLAKKDKAYKNLYNSIIWRITQNNKANSEQSESAPSM